MNATLLMVTAAGGFIGAPARLFVDRAIAWRSLPGLPWGTLVVNVTGSIVLGFLAGVMTVSGVPKVVATLLGTGFCGSFTTFSTFTFETVGLGESDRFIAAAANVLVGLTAGIAGAIAGYWFGLVV